MNDVDTPNLCAKCGRLDQAGHVCPASSDTPAMPPGYHPTAAFLRHPQDSVVTHPQDVAADGAVPQPITDDIETGPHDERAGKLEVSDSGHVEPVQPLTRAARAARQSAVVLAAGDVARSLSGVPIADQLPLPGMPVPKGPPPGGPSVSEDWQGSGLNRAAITADVGEDMAHVMARATGEAMEVLSSTAGQIMTRGDRFKERLLPSMLVAAFTAGAGLGGKLATERAIQYGLYDPRKV